MAATWLQFNAFIPNTKEIIFERQISQINNGGNRLIVFNIVDNV